MTTPDLDKLRTLFANPPMISLNDDDTVSIEWEASHGVLHVMLDGDEIGAYLECGGRDWDTDAQTAAALRRAFEEPAS